MNKINFSIEDLQKCKEFSELVDTSFYAQRNQFDSAKRTVDSMIGKLAELAVYYSLVEKYPTITYPDFKIYSAKQKSWDYDLKASEFNLHVKAVRGESNFPESWIFQSTDKHIFKYHLDIDYVAFVKVNLLKQEAEIRAITSVNMLHKNELFALPVLEKLQKANKLAVYYKDLEKHSDLMWLL